MRHITLRIIAVLVLVAAVAGIAVLAYNAGATHQAAITTQVPSVQGGGAAYPVYGWWPFPFFGFGIFGLLAAFFLFWLFFAALRFVVFGPRFGWRRWHRGYGHWHDPGSGGDIPPMFVEMHRRMHENEAEKPTDQATQK